MKWFLIFCAVILVIAIGGVGCSTMVVHEEPEVINFDSSSEIDVTAIVEELLKFRGVRVYAIEGEWRKQGFSVEYVLKGESGKVTLILLSPQMRLMTITLEPPHRITAERARSLPFAFKPEYLLVDLALAKFDVATLRRVFNSRFTIVETGNRVSITSSNGNLVAERTNVVDGIELFNSIWNYRYRMKKDISQ